MHFRHFNQDEHGRDGRGEERGRCVHDGFGRDGRFGRHWRGGYEPRDGRPFDSGDLRFVILAMLAEKPRHGYEIIKALGERVGGDYSPSPGAENKAQVDAIFARLDGAEGARRGDFGPVLRAMENLRMAVRLRVRRREGAAAVVQAIADALDAAAKAVERL